MAVQNRVKASVLLLETDETLLVNVVVERTIFRVLLSNEQVEVPGHAILQPLDAQDLLVKPFLAIETASVISVTDLQAILVDVGVVLLAGVVFCIGGGNQTESSYLIDVAGEALVLGGRVFDAVHNGSLDTNSIFKVAHTRVTQVAGGFAQILDAVFNRVVSLETDVFGLVLHPRIRALVAVVLVDDGELQAENRGLQLMFIALAIGALEEPELAIQAAILAHILLAAHQVSLKTLSILQVKAVQTLDACEGVTGLLVHFAIDNHLQTFAHVDVGFHARETLLALVEIHVGFFAILNVVAEVSQNTLVVGEEKLVVTLEAGLFLHHGENLAIGDVQHWGAVVGRLFPIALHADIAHTLVHIFLAVLNFLLWIGLANLTLIQEVALLACSTSGLVYNVKTVLMEDLRTEGNVDDRPHFHNRL